MVARGSAIGRYAGSGEHFNELLLADSNAIGFVAVTGDTVISCDLFANNALYRSQAGSLTPSSRKAVALLSGCSRIRRR